MDSMIWINDKLFVKFERSYYEHVAIGSLCYDMIGKEFRLYMRQVWKNWKIFEIDRGILK